MERCRTLPQEAHKEAEDLFVVGWFFGDRESKVNRERSSITREKHETLIRPFPISVDFEGLDKLSQSHEVKEAMENLSEEYFLEGKKVLLGLDRLDYTKGIPERLRAFDRFMEKHRKYKGKIIFLQMGEPSRMHIPQYKVLNDEIDSLVEEINYKHSTDNWKPITMVRRHLAFHELIAFYRLGDLCVVSSLHDGMNLVAKEFISSRSDNGGMLVLSQFTGAARELQDALLVNPYDQEGFSEDIYRGLSMPEKEKKRRMERLRQTVQQNNIFRWAGMVLSELFQFEFKE